MKPDCHMALRSLRDPLDRFCHSWLPVVFFTFIGGLLIHQQQGRGTPFILSLVSAAVLTGVPYLIGRIMQRLDDEKRGELFGFKHMLATPDSTVRHLKHASDLVSKYGSVLQTVPKPLGFPIHERLLPASKDDIKRAIIAKALLLKATGRLDEKTRNALQVGYAGLANFISDLGLVQRSDASLHAASNSRGDARELAERIVANPPPSMQETRFIVEEYARLASEFENAIRAPTDCIQAPAGQS